MESDLLVNMALCNGHKVNVEHHVPSINYVKVYSIQCQHTKSDKFTVSTCIPIRQLGQEISAVVRMLLLRGDRHMGITDTVVMGVLIGHIHSM